MLRDINLALNEDKYLMVFLYTLPRKACKVRRVLVENLTVNLNANRPLRCGNPDWLWIGSLRIRLWETVTSCWHCFKVTYVIFIIWTKLGWIRLHWLAFWPKNVIQQMIQTLSTCVYSMKTISLIIWPFVRDKNHYERT